MLVDHKRSIQRGFSESSLRKKATQLLRVLGEQSLNTKNILILLGAVTMLYVAIFGDVSKYRRRLTDSDPMEPVGFVGGNGKKDGRILKRATYWRVVAKEMQDRADRDEALAGTLMDHFENIIVKKNEKAPAIINRFKNLEDIVDAFDGIDQDCPEEITQLHSVISLYFRVLPTLDSINLNFLRDSDLLQDLNLKERFTERIVKTKMRDGRMGNDIVYDRMAYLDPDTIPEIVGDDFSCEYGLYLVLKKTLSEILHQLKLHHSAQLIMRREFQPQEFVDFQDAYEEGVFEIVLEGNNNVKAC